MGKRFAKSKRVKTQEEVDYLNRPLLYPVNIPRFSLFELFHSAGANAPVVPAMSEANRNRLVEGSKSTTRDNELKGKAIAYRERALSIASKPQTGFVANTAGALSTLEHRELKQAATESETTASNRNVKGAGTATVCEFREWCDTYRIRTVVTPDMALKPPTQSGERISETLSSRAALKIAESCQYLAEQFDGYKTFVTWTFNDEIRSKFSVFDIETRKPVTTIQKEITRSMDGLVKMYKRGWEYKNEKGEAVKVEALGEKLRYCWVAEVPKNEAGEDNPHIHMLMDWRVEHKHFASWARRIESIWGNGFATLEKIKDKDAAGAYMAKAAGYISKANGESDQGVIRGNRYAISSAARAPDWVTVSLHEFGIMGRLIRETFDAMQYKHAPELEERREQARRRDEMTKRIKACDDEDEKQLLKNKRKTIAGKLMAVREKINARPIRASKYHVEIKTKTMFDKFLDRCRAVGWGSDKPACTKWIYERKIFRGAWFTKGLMRYTDNLIDKRSSFYESANDGWQEYQTMAVG